MAAQVEGLFEFAHHLRERAAHAMTLEIGSTHRSVHHSTARSV
ncbi:MAG TPA: hypothetical protein VGX91_08475 [Candidatus Cybelea sp.]|jgi:hypothetical protein|nr:hypothetical protein [Candidatus Cybelea sp.]